MTQRKFGGAVSLSLVLLTATAIFTSSCAEKQSSAPAPEKQAAEKSVDLSQAKDVFDAPAVAAPAAAALDPTTVVATVDGNEIRQSEVNDEVTKAIARMRGRVPPERMAQMQERLAGQALDAMITRRLLLKAIGDEKIEVTDKDLSDAMDKITASLPPGTTIDDVYTRSNVTADEFKKDLTTDLRINKLLETHTESVPEPSAAAVKAYYDGHKDQFEQPESVKASHILIAFEPGDTDKAKADKKAKIEAIRKQLLDGGDFAKLAEENSDDPGSKKAGGDLGTFQRGQMVPEFEKAAFSQKTGEVGEVVETQFGYHLIKVSEHTDAHAVSFDEVNEKLAKYLRTQDRRKAAEDYIDKLRAKAKVDIKIAQAGSDADMDMPMSGAAPAAAPESAPAASPEATPAPAPETAPASAPDTTAAPAPAPTTAAPAAAPAAEKMPATPAPAPAM